jgi:hypothetical protein
MERVATTAHRNNPPWKGLLRHRANGHGGDEDVSTVGMVLFFRWLVGLLFHFGGV